MALSLIPKSAIRNSKCLYSVMLNLVQHLWFFSFIWLKKLRFRNEFGMTMLLSRIKNLVSS